MSLRCGALLGLMLCCAAQLCAQRGGWGGGWGGEGGWIDESVKNPRQVPSHSTGTPEWENPKAFSTDVFTFARIRYTSVSNGRMRRGGTWTTDTPDSDLNLSYRLQQMTSLKVSPDGRFIRLTDPELYTYPWIYIVEPGRLQFTADEVTALRKYLLNGGFLWFDDFWGDMAWENVAAQMKRVFPERGFTELPLEHPLYRSVFAIKEKGQVPNIRVGEQSQYTGVTWEYHDGDTRTVHHRVISDDKGRLMVLATHNTDNGDGWEREGEAEYYFKNFSEKISYPLAINVIFYIMTH